MHLGKYSALAAATEWIVTIFRKDQSLKDFPAIQAFIRITRKIAFYSNRKKIACLRADRRDTEERVDCLCLSVNASGRFGRRSGG